VEGATKKITALCAGHVPPLFARRQCTRLTVEQRSAIVLQSII